MRQIDGKYQTSGDITKLDGTPIPEDEPLILFRGKDKLLPGLLESYKKLCQDAGSPQEQIDAVEKRNEIIKAWQAANPDKIKIPD
jgi:hypothetical protein